MQKEALRARRPRRSMILASKLSIHRLELNVNLGWRKAERKQVQAVFLDLRIGFPKPPLASSTDNLADTVCYAELIANIRQQIAGKNYKLIEHLSAEIYAIAKSKLPKKATLQIRLTKYPKITGLSGGVTFDYGEDDR